MDRKKLKYLGIVAAAGAVCFWFLPGFLGKIAAGICLLIGVLGLRPTKDGGSK